MRRWLILILIAVALSGCQMQQGSGESVGRPVIQRIEFTGDSGCKIFTNEEKMRKILNKIRLLGQKFSPEVDPEDIPGEELSLCILRCDGTCQEYRFKDDQYVRQGKRAWQQTESRQLVALRLLLEELPADG
jgi:hypothetical protein